MAFHYDSQLMQNFSDELARFYVSHDYTENYIKIYKESIRSAIMDTLIDEITKEIREELKQNAENFVIKNCQARYKNLLMTGPFSTEDQNKRSERDEYAGSSKTRRDDDPNVVIPDRPRCTVMGVILQQIDSNNQLVSLAIVDKYGELVAHKDLQHLMPPRKFNMAPG